MQKYYFLVMMFSVLSLGLFAQSGEISGKIIDENGEGVPFASVAIVENGKPTGIGATTDFDGFYSIKPLSPGKYDVQFSNIGYTTIREVGVVVKNDQTTYMDKKLAPSEQVIEEVVVIQYKVPLIDAGETSSKNTVTAEDIAALPTRSIENIASTTAGVQQTDKGGAINIRGGRGDAVVYYIDGIRVSGAVNLPVSAIEQIDIITGGVSAKFGNSTSGVINISTKGGAKQFVGGLEVQSSLDRWRFDLVNLNFAGPLVKNDEGQSIVSYSVNAEYQRQKDARPSSVDMYKVKDDLFTSLQETPLALSPEGNLIVRPEQLTFDSLEVNKLKRNTVDNQARFNGKLDFRLGKGKFLTVGGNMDYRQYHRWIEEYSLLNFENNPLYKEQNYKTFIRFSHNFDKQLVEGQKQGAIQNAFYSMQFDFEKYKREYQDDSHGNDYWNYGYIGAFDVQRAPVFAPSADAEFWELSNYSDTAVYFTGSSVNQQGSNYTSTYFDLLGETDQNGDRYIQGGINDLQASQALINGERAEIPYQIWFNTGRQYNGVGVDNDDERYRFQVNSGFDILKPGAESRNKHSLTFGFEYEQQVMRSYAVSPLALWDAANANVNNHLEFDTDNPFFYNNGELTAVGNNPVYFSDTIFYDYVSTPFNEDGARVQSTFDENIRAANGIAENQFLNIYNMPLESFDINYFSPDELIGTEYNGLTPVQRNYRGYDVYGNRTSGKVSFEDFWQKRDENGVNTRPVAPFTPIYAAGYIEDKFQLKDLTFRLGFRVDRYDANQKVLQDPYSVFGSVNAGDFGLADKPENIGDDYAVYTSDGTSSGAVVGYRDGDVFFDTEGVEVRNYNSLGSSAAVPVKSDEQGDNTQDENYRLDLAFEDYEVSYVFMPRLQFSFSITDNALFFAHYDVLSQSPQSRINNGFIINRSIGNPMDYFFFNQIGGAAINNPNLRPETTVDFQLGFKQKVSASSAITFSAYYKEFRDQIQIKRLNGVNGAQGGIYYTYDNIDFGNTKGFEFGYDLRRTKNIRITANYTLQFAEGTGSDDVTQAQVVRNAGTNFRSVNPLDFDSRHSMNLSFDYRFGEGKEYNGPVSKKGKQILSNFGINVLAQARSGTPYTRQDNPTPAGLTTSSRTVTLGYINGSRIGWNFRADLKISKSFSVDIAKKNDEKDGKKLYFDIYLWIDNLLGTANVLNVYRYTGSASDDGFIDSPLGQLAVDAANTPDSYRDLYNARINSPTNFTAPRRIYLGASVNF
jgi:outer membrane receptor protein involved in Fe transport